MSLPDMIMEFLRDLLLVWRNFSLSYSMYNDSLRRLAFRLCSYLVMLCLASILIDQSVLPSIFSVILNIATWKLFINYCVPAPLRIPTNRWLYQREEGPLNIQASNVLQQPVLAQITFQLHSDLEARGILSEWIPRQYTCPITLMIIDGTPVYAKNNPERFNRNALLNWLDKHKSHPITREDLSPDELKSDFVMQGKIKVFSHWVLLKKEYLKHLNLAEAMVCINQFTESLDRVFADKNGPVIHSLAEQLINRLQTSAKEIECKKSLVVAKKEVSAFSAASTKILFFQRLNLSADAKPTQIEQAYRRLARGVHPDKNSRPEAKNIFFKLTEARDFLLKKRHVSSETPDLESHEEIQRLLNTSYQKIS